MLATGVLRKLPSWCSYLGSEADRQGTGMLRRGPEGTTLTNPAVLLGLIHDHQVRDPRSVDPESLVKELHQHGVVHR